MRLSRLGLLPAFNVARPKDDVLSAGVLRELVDIGVSPVVPGEAGVGQCADGVGVVSSLEVLWNEEASERDSLLGFERFRLSTGGKGVDENRGDDNDSLRGDSCTPCMDWRKPGVSDGSSPEAVERGNKGLPSRGGEDVKVMVEVATGMFRRRRPRPRTRALDGGGAARKVANSMPVSVSTSTSTLTSTGSTSMGGGCDVRLRLMGDSPLTTRRGGGFGALGLDRLPSTDEGENVVVGERMGRDARGEWGEQ